MNILHTLSRDELDEQYIRKKFQKSNALRFWSKNVVNIIYIYIYIYIYIIYIYIFLAHNSSNLHLPGINLFLYSPKELKTNFILV